MTILTLTLNPALDLSVSVPTLCIDRVNAACEQHLGAAGKGINVARALSDLGHSPLAAGFLGNDNDGAFRQLFAQHGITDECIRLAGSTRINIKISEADGRVTDINTLGLTITDGAWAQLWTRLNALTADFSVLVISGSLPPGVSVAQFSELITWGRRHHKQVILDTSGPALRAGITALPTLIKPNIDELSELMGRPLVDEADIIRSAHQLQQQGVAHVVVSMGAEGVYWFTPTTCWRAQVPSVKVVSTVGAGDSLVAGLSAGLSAQQSSQQDAAQILRAATALSLMAVTQVGVGIRDAQQYADYQAAITITELAPRRV